jgi:hypothetical protein
MPQRCLEPLIGYEDDTHKGLTPRHDWYVTPKDLLKRETSSFDIYYGNTGRGSRWSDFGAELKSYKISYLRTGLSSFSNVANERVQRGIDELRRVLEESARENWDGYGALPAQVAAYDYAVALLASLPAMIPTPDISVDPDGEIAFDWFWESRLTFSISISADGRLSYAGLFGPNRTHGAEQFSGALPGTISGGLARLFVEGHRLGYAPA